MTTDLAGLPRICVFCGAPAHGFYDGVPKCGAHCKTDVPHALELLKTNRRLTAAIWFIIDTFDDAVRAFEQRGKGGQQVPFHGDFASMPPSSASTMRRLARELRTALKDEWPDLREEFRDKYPKLEANLDEMFKERQP